jgi:hypothetical protein
MRLLSRLAVLAAVVSVFATYTNAQWQCLYVTLDDNPNGTGDRTVGSAVIKEDMFVALCMRPGTRCYLIPYVDADSALGRKYTYGYAVSGIYQVWTDGGFDQVTMTDAFALKATPDSLIYVASNDQDHNVLVFKYTEDTITVVSPYPRQATGSNSIFGIDVDGDGYVYVCNDTTTGQTADLKVYAPIDQWTPASHADSPVQTIDLPDGVYKGIAVNQNGTAVYISDYGNRRVVKYTGSRTSGYSLDAGFSWTIGPQDTVSGVPTKRAGPIGLAHLASKNILAVAVDSLLKPTTTGYGFGRIYLLNGNTGEPISTDTSVAMIDQAAWNLWVTGSYASAGAGTASGYAATMDVDWDENENLYSQSMYGWTVEKWRYNGTLPDFTTGVEELGGELPSGYSLSQNYPNPFNPTTTIEFSVPQSGFVSLKVFDLLGREVATLANEVKTAGNYRATFDARNLPSGTYFYSLKTDGYSSVKSMVIVK